MDTRKINKGNAKMIAHKGLSGLEIENTTAAFVAAGNHSYFGIETDLFKTADGQFVLCHDRNLKKLAGEDIEIPTSTLSELMNVVLFDKDGTKNRNDLKIPTLENYISICKKYDKHCILELCSAFTDDDISRIIEIYKQYDYLENVTFISFTYENLVKVRKILPNHPVQHILSPFDSGMIDKLIEDQMGVAVYYEWLKPEDVERMHNAGLKVNCWTVDCTADAEQLASWGVDYITTNILE